MTMLTAAARPMAGTTTSVWTVAAPPNPATTAVPDGPSTHTMTRFVTVSRR